MKEIEFEWDQWNIQKNEIKHGVSHIEAQSAFYDPLYKLYADLKHSLTTEKRFILYGKSMEGKILMIGFTLRRNKIRIITARSASKKERTIYESKN